MTFLSSLLGSSSNHGSLESIITDITNSTSHKALLNALKTHCKRDIGDTILASPLPGGQDPLGILNPQTHTLGYLYILSARLAIPGCPPVSLATIATFCRTFEPAVARLAGDRIAMLSRGIVQLVQSQNNLQAAIVPLSDLVTRYPPNLTYMTAIHPHFLHACVATHHFTAALPVLSCNISEVDTVLSPLTIDDILRYHYLGSLAFLALKRYNEAANLLELVVSIPAQQHPAAIQLEALKKLALVQLITHGAMQPLPRYTHPNLTRYLKTSPYFSIIKAFPALHQLNDVIKKEGKLFTAECNLGLIRQVVDQAPRWSIRKLTATYFTLSLGEIGKIVNMSEIDTVRRIVLSMIERREIRATLDTTGTVTFQEDETAHTTEDVNKLLRDAQMQSLTLSEVDREMGRSKEFLTKAKEKEGVLGHAYDEELYMAPSGYRGDWDE